MIDQQWIPLICGTSTGLGLLLIAMAIAGRTPQVRLPAFSPVKLAGCLATGGLTWVLTGWPVGAVLAALAAAVLPGLLAPDHVHRAELARIEAIASWSEMLRDTLAGAAGLEQAIVASAPIAPAPIRAEIGEVAVRIERGERLGSALRHLASRLDDPTADVVIAALVLADERNARDLAALLGSLASSTRDQATMRMRVAASRARTRTSSRVITVITLSVAVVMLLLRPEYLRPYDSTIGQLALAAVGGLFAAGIWLLQRMARYTRPGRILPEPGAEP
jgi:tight adherence protein B